MNWNVQSWWPGIKEFFAEVKTEMKKVSWPAREEVMGTTTVVIIATFIFGFYLYAADWALYHVVEQVYKFFGV
jgi:preprotein translocase subunit SecE